MKEPYFVDEANTTGWDVIGPEGCVQEFCWDGHEEAQDLVLMLNHAYKLGQKAKNKAKNAR